VQQINEFLESLDGLLQILPRDDQILGVLVLFVLGFVFWRGGNNMLDRGRGGAMSRQGSASVVMGAFSYIAAAGLLVHAATGWTAKRSLITGIGLLLGGLISYHTGAMRKIRRSIRDRLRGPQAPALDPEQISSFQDFLDQVDGADFERFVGWVMRKRGYQSIQNTGGTGDGGIDLTARKNGLQYVVQCKRYADKPVGASEVRDFYGALSAEGADHGFLFATSRFTKAARAFAKKTGKLNLLDKRTLAPWVEKYAARPLSVTCRYCGSENRVEARYCSRCGAPIE